MGFKKKFPLKWMDREWRYINSDIPPLCDMGGFYSVFRYYLLSYGYLESGGGGTYQVCAGGDGKQQRGIGRCAGVDYAAVRERHCYIHTYGSFYYEVALRCPYAYIG